VRLPIETILVKEVAKRIKKLYPQVSKVYLVGSRSRRKIGNDLDFVATVRGSRRLPSRNATIKSDHMQVNIFFARPCELDTHLLEFGLGMDIIRWKKAAISRGLKLNRYGLWKGKKLVSHNMAEIAAILGKELKRHLIETKANPL